MKRFSFFKVAVQVIVLSIASIVPAFAILDNDGDGMSDLWEDVYGFSLIDNGLLFSSQAPQADPDGDGWSNVKESIAGTDPLSGQPPVGLVQATITQNETVPGVFVISWQALAGKQYTLFVSPDLTPGSWTEVGDSMIGEGIAIALAIETDTEIIDKLFWRVAVEDIDRDSDGLSDFEEGLIGSDPLLVDSDGDGIPDVVEAGRGVNPIAQDAAEAELNVRVLSL